MKKKKTAEEEIIPQYLSFNKDLCTACCECIRKCPIKAIRLAHGRSLRMVEQCIGCGECIRVCQSGAMSIKTVDLNLSLENKYSVALLSPVIYTQFQNTLPDDIIEEIKNIGFNKAIDISYYIETYQHAATEYIKQNRKKRNSNWPIISPICPVVTRLISTKFPELKKNILPFQRPIFLASGDIRQKISVSENIKPKDIFICHITPCPYKIATSEYSDTHLNNSIGINNIFGKLFTKTKNKKRHIHEMFADKRISYYISKRSYLWGLSGGEVSGMKLFNTLSVSGLSDTITYLEKIEMGLLKGIEYIELRTCPEGCIGGALTGTDKFIAKNTAFKMAEVFGGGRRVPRHQITHLFESNFFFKDHLKTKTKKENQTYQKPLSIKELSRVEELYTLINGKNCAACGAPDCRSFAEDVIRGRISEKACTKLMLLKNRKKKNEKGHNR